MSTTRLIRWSGLAAMLGGVLLIAGSVNWEQTPWRWLGSIGSLLLVYGVMGIYAVQVQDSGLPGFLGFVLLVAGSIFLMGSGDLVGMPYWLLGSFLSAAGLILLAIGTLSSGRFPRWVAWLWIAAVIVGLPSVFAPSLQGVLGLLGSAAAGLGMAWAGYVLWSRPG
ncbi:MAG: hypothetical protein V1755_02235 [Chloroflexota bacterium]